MATGVHEEISLSGSHELNFFAYSILFVATVCAASCGTVAMWLPGIPGLLTASWQMQTQALMCVPLAFAELAFAVPKTRTTAAAALRDPECWQLVLLTSVSWVLWGEGFFAAADYSSVARVWAYNNAHTVLMVLLVLATGQKCVAGERLGVATALFGMVLMQVPVMFGRGLVPLAGDAVALCSSVAAMYFLDFSSRLRQRLPLFTFILPVSVCNAFLHSLMAYWLQGGDFGRTERGAFGWTSSPETLLFALYLGGVVGLLGTTSCIVALAHLPPVLVSVTQALVPPVGTVAAVLFGVVDMPDHFTAAGGALMAVGVILIAKASASKEVLVVDLNPTVESLSGKIV